MLYSDLAHLRVEITATDTSGDAYVLAALREACARIDELLGLEFAPRLKTRHFDALGYHIDDERRLLQLDEPLLVATEIVTAEGETLTPSAYALHPLDERRGPTPYDGIRLVASGSSWSDYAGDWQDAIAVTGIWGFHRRYEQSWRSSGDAVVDGINSSTTQIAVTDADGPDASAWSPRFSPGQLIQIGSEWLNVEAVDAEENILTVQRGVRGSTAAAHDSGATISLWQPEEPIQRAVNRWVAYVYARRGAFEQATYDGFTTVKFPEDIPAEVQHILDQYDLSDPLLAV